MHLIGKKSTFGLLNISLLCFGLLLVGCGGGGAGGSSTGPTQTGNVGPVAVTFTGHPQVIVSGSSGTVTAVGQAGASYTSLSMNPAHTLNSTFLAFSRLLGNTDEIYLLPAVQSGVPTNLVHAGASYFPSFSQSGVMAYGGYSGSSWSIDTILSDGSQQKLVASGVYTYYPAISPSGATIAYVGYSGTAYEIYSIPSGGGTPTTLYSGPAVFTPNPVVWSPSGASIAFTAQASGTAPYHVYTMTASGGSVTDITPSAYTSDNWRVCSWSPDGNTLACTHTPSGSAVGGIALMSPTGALPVFISPSSYNDSFACFAPDNGHLALYRTNAGGATAGIYETDLGGTSPQLVLADPPASGNTGAVVWMAWSPYLEGQIFVGAHGTITASPVNGFLVSQNGSQFGSSLLTFTATTPSTATLTQSGTNSAGAPLAFTLTADSITNISYANVYNGAHTTIPLTTTPTAVVTVDAVTGAIDYVVPAIAGKAHPMATTTGNAVTYAGAFSAIYDRTGKNLAPGGATTVQFDRTSGKLISFR